jgi:hypothetical protein
MMTGESGCESDMMLVQKQDKQKKQNKPKIKNQIKKIMMEEN